MSADTHQTANPGYALGQLARALKTAQDHPDPATRQRAQDKHDRWAQVLKGMADGTLRIGARTPVASTPAWVTLEVAHGGFATGAFVAEGPRLQHETLVLERLPADVPGQTERERLNLFFSSDQGQRELLQALRTGRYAVDVPEEAALLVVAWLVAHDHGEAALELLAELRPLMHRLRLYPRLTEHAHASGTGVHLTTASAVTAALRGTRSSPRVTAMNTTLSVWNPLYDALVSLWLTTVQGDAPRLERDSNGLVRDPQGQPVATGGSPCSVWPDDWQTARQLWLARYDAAVAEHRACGRHHHPKSNFQLLRRLLLRSGEHLQAHSDAFVAAVRHTLACAIHKHGVPGQADAVARRELQARQAALPRHRDIARTLAARLANVPEGEGIGDLAIVERAIESGEHERVPAGTPIPARFVRKAERALLAPIDELVERGIIGSAEVLAIVLPQLTSQVAAAGITDPACRDLFARTYAAFRRRRSLLLLNLEHQVTIDELPWIAALAPFRARDLGTKALALHTLREVTALTFENFPHTIIPNPLLREMVPLARGAGIEVPFVEEIAADIFMGTFTKKFSDAAQLTSTTLEGTVYARYYDLPPPQRGSGRVGRLRSRWGKRTNPQFDARCADRAAEAGRGGGPVARNGAVLEQCQILTSYNLSALVTGLQLHDDLRREADTLATKALRWACTRQQQLPDDYLPRLRTTKNTAYAWRQAIFFLSFAEPRRQREVVDDIARELAETSPATFERMRPAFEGLTLVINGGTFGSDGRGPAGQRRFLGWACGPHWLVPATDAN